MTCFDNLPVKMSSKLDGTLGESIAEDWLKNHGYRIISKNYRYRKWEVDIICKLNHELVFVEVKMRQTRKFGEPWLAVNKKKQAAICVAANHYIQKHDHQGAVRFDIISILPDDRQEWAITHISDAFRPELI